MFQEIDDVLAVRADDLREVFYHLLAKRAGPNWEEIGLYLDVEYGFMDQLRMDYPSGVEGNSVSCARRVFIKWMKSGGKTLKDLHDALLEAEQGAMASFVLHKATKYKK